MTLKRSSKMKSDQLLYCLKPSNAIFIAVSGFFIIPLISSILRMLSLFININKPFIILFATKGPSYVIDVYNWIKCAPHNIFAYADWQSETPPAAIK